MFCKICNKKIGNNNICSDCSTCGIEYKQEQELQKYYSGKNSHNFWDLINSKRPDLYSFGVVLQDLEDYILKQLK